MRLANPKRWIVALVLATCTAGPAWALEPDELALICNKRVPASVQLAKQYAQLRKVPEDRIIPLDLPAGEQMGADRFDPEVVSPIRQYLTEHDLRTKVKCLVTFYGVPLKLTPRANAPAEVQELKDLHQQSEQIRKQIGDVVTTLEGQVKTFDLAFRPASAVTTEQLLKRADTAVARAAALAGEIPEPEARNQLLLDVVQAIDKLSGPAGLLRSLKLDSVQMAKLVAQATTQPAAGKSPLEQLEALQEQVKTATLEMRGLVPRRWDAAARRRMLEVAKTNFGLTEADKVCQMQIDYLTPAGTNALDNQLALLWFDVYPHKAWLPNPLVYRSSDRDKTPAIMVARLDGPESGTAQQIMLACKSVESSGGLQGRVVVDSRGLLPTKADGKPDGYGQFDQRLRELCNVLRGHTMLSLYSDDADSVIAAHSQRNVALYCGWYSVRNYVPSCQFVPGAVGYHVASYEMVSLRNPEEKGWCRGLLLDGIGATLGAVDEPYLLAFPDPAEFFPLLLTGKYSLAEVYWMTEPAVNWKIVLIGDPLYKPYAAKPAMKVEELPAELRSFVMGNAK